MSTNTSFDFEGESAQTLQGFADGFDAPRSTNDASPAIAPCGRRAKIWELDGNLTCPVVGTCLNIEEVRRLARKHGAVAAQASDYEAHVTVVGCCKSRNALAEDVQRALDRKHALWIARFARTRTEDGARQLWQEALERGEAAGALWGVLTCRLATEPLRRSAYEDIHMLSHQVGAGVRLDLKRAAALQARVAELEADLQRARSRAERAKAQNDHNTGLLWRQLAAARQREEALEQLRRRIAQLESGAEVEALRRQLEESRLRLREFERLKERLALLESAVGEAQAEQRRLAQALAQAQAERDALEQLGMALADSGATRSACAPPDFAGRRLLCVGGRANLVAQYRALVERAGGVFEWHDGGREEAVSRLPDLLARHDAVICPADCVSHPAYYQLKRHCKLTGKPCLLLRGSGLASFAEGLRRLAEGRVHIGAEQPD
jgi:hypothetical protein